MQQPITTFKEVQWMRQVWWVTLIILVAAGLGWLGFVEQIIFRRPYGTNPGPDWLVWLLWLGMGIGLPALFLNLRLVVEVRVDQLWVQYVPFIKRQIPFTDIEQVEAITYRPLRDYGGWGVRGWGSRQAYTVSGNRGVQLTLRAGHRLLLGSRRADELAQAITVRLAR